MKIRRLYEDIDTEVPGTPTDPGHVSKKTKTVTPKESDIYILGLYLATEKGKDLSAVLAELRRSPQYIPIMIEKLGGMNKMVKEISDPISIQEISKYINPMMVYEFLWNFAGKFIPDKGRAGRKFMTINFVRKLNDKHILPYEYLETRPDAIEAEYKKLGGNDGILNLLSRPENMSELTRMYTRSNFGLEFIKHILSSI